MEKVRRLASIELPNWDEIPSYGLYKGELLDYLKEVLRPLYVVDRNVITSSMINNYVKLDYIEKPDNKKYMRSTIAQLIVIAIFKQAISIEDIVKGIEIEIKNFAFKESYQDFVGIFTCAKKDFLNTNNNLNIKVNFKEHRDKVWYYLSASLFTKLYTKISIDDSEEK